MKTNTAPTAQPAKQPHEQVHDALMDAICSVASDASLDLPAKMTKIKSILRAEEESLAVLTGNGTAPPAKSSRQPQPNADSASYDDDDSVTESDRSPFVGRDLETFFDEMKDDGCGHMPAAIKLDEKRAVEALFELNHSETGEMDFTEFSD